MLVCTLKKRNVRLLYILYNITDIHFPVISTEFRIY
jgi:hypothetical protein